VEPVHEPGEVADAIAVRVHVGSHGQAVDDGVLVPEVVDHAGARRGCSSLACSNRYAHVTALSGSPVGCDQSTLAVLRACDARIVETFADPQFTGDLAVALIESLAVVRVEAEPYFASAAALHLAKPVRIGERLPCEAHDVRATF